MPTKKRARRRYRDSRAQLLTNNAVVILCVDATLALLLASYRATALELGPYGSTLAAVVLVLAAIAATCLFAAYRLEALFDRRLAAAEAADAGFAEEPLQADPPAAAPVPTRPKPGPAGPAAVRTYPVGPGPIQPAAAVREPAPADAVVVIDGEVTEPAHH